MRSTKELPQNYGMILGIDLSKDKRLATLVTVLSLGIAAAAFAVGCLSVSPLTIFDMSSGIGRYALRFGVLLAGMVVYILLHEAVHGIFFRMFSGEKPFFGMTLMYAYAGSHSYFGKTEYLIIALSPIVLWGVVLGILGVFVPPEWFWTVYVIQILNLSGAAGDLYVFFRFLKLPRDILVQDTGVAMQVYAPAE